MDDTGDYSTDSSGNTSSNWLSTLNGLATTGATVLKAVQPSSSTPAKAAAAANGSGTSSSTMLYIAAAVIGLIVVVLAIRK